jgi:hypothetical protein
VQDDPEASCFISRRNGYREPKSVVSVCESSDACMIITLVPTRVRLRLQSLTNDICMYLPMVSFNRLRNFRYLLNVSFLKQSVTVEPGIFQSARCAGTLLILTMGISILKQTVVASTRHMSPLLSNVVEQKDCRWCSSAVRK